MGNTQKLGNYVNAIFQDASNNVGIGAAPSGSYKLEVTGTAKVSSTLLVSGAATFSGFVGINGSPATAFPLEAYINSSTAYTTSSRGNVMRVYNSNTGANIFAGIELGGAGTANDGLAGLNAVVTGSGSAALTFYTRDSNTFAERMRITSAGNVGIGTSSPSGLGRALVVTNTSDYPEVIVERLSSGAGKFGMLIGNSGDFLIRNYTAGTNPMLITSGGNVLIGTSTDGGYKLEVVGTFKVGGSAYFTGSVYNYVGANRFFASGGTINYLYSGSASLNLINQADTGTIGTFNGTTGVYTATSDINKKKDFEPSTIGLNEVLQLKPTLYRMKSEDESSPKQLGFIAQEVELIIPQAYTENGEGKDKFIGLNFNPIVAALVKAIQQLSKQNEELSNRLNKAGL